jgi:putative heme-binding domain-containing protein
MVNRRLVRFSGALCVASVILAAALSAQENPDDASDALPELVKILAESDDPSFHLDILKGMSDALKGRRGVKMPAGWPQVSEKLARSPSEEVRNLARALSTQFGDEASLQQARKTALDKAATPEDRNKALASLLETKPKDFALFLQQVLADPVLRGAALRGLGTYDDAKTPQAVLAHYKDFTPAEKLDALNTLAGREAYALELLKAIDAKTIARTELTAAVIRTLGELKNQNVDQWIATNWGAVRSSPEEKLKEMADIRAMVQSAKPDEVSASRGRAVYARTCAQCHTLFGEGGKVGPDLTGSGRADLEYILSNVVDPNAVVGKDYQMWVIRTRDRQQLAGLLAREDEHTVTIVTENQTTVLPRKEIARMKQSDTSMMPEGLLTGLPKNELLDLIAYVRSPQQVPMAATQPATQPAAQPAGAAR